MNTDMGKIYQYRIRRIDVGKYQVEEQYTVLFIKKLWRVGSRRLQLQEYYETSAKAAKAILDAAKLKGMEVRVTDLERLLVSMRESVKAQARTARKAARKADELARNLRRIKKDHENRIETK